MESLLGAAAIVGAQTADVNGNDIKSKGIGSEGRAKVFALIDDRRLERECFIRSIEMLHPHIVVMGYSWDSDCLRTLSSGARPDAIILNIGSRLVTSPEVQDEVTALLSEDNPIPVVILAECEEFEQIISAIDMGAMGYIPASVGIDAIAEAMILTSSGGIFLTASCLTSLKSSISKKNAAPFNFRTQFTSRQLAVAEALHRGKPNKIIAYELNMCESTVKVHIRNILKKLNASNRTEAAFKLNAIYSSSESSTD